MRSGKTKTYALVLPHTSSRNEIRYDYLSFPKEIFDLPQFILSYSINYALIFNLLTKLSSIPQMGYFFANV